MKSKRFVLNALLVVAILTLFVFSYSYMNQPRFGYAYTLFFRRNNLQHYRLHWRNLFLCSRPRIKRTGRFVVSYNLNQKSQTHSATSAKQGINLFAIMIILQIATVLIIALTATNVFEVWVRIHRELSHGNCRGYSGFVYDTGKEVDKLTGPIWNPNRPWNRRCRFWCRHPYWNRHPWGL